jgi:hypothetical protein
MKYNILGICKVLSDVAVGMFCIYVIVKTFVI